MTVTVDKPMPDGTHWLLSRLVGRIPDDVIYEARGWIAEGDIAGALQAIAFSALAGGVPMSPRDLTGLTESLTAVGADVSTLAGLEQADAIVYPSYGLAPAGPDVLAADGDSIPYSLDLTAEHAVARPDDIDLAAIAAVKAIAEEPDGDCRPMCLWRTWRYPPLGEATPPPRRIYLVQADAAQPGALAVLAARVQEKLVAAGESVPQVEVFDEPSLLPDYQWMALRYAALLWAEEPGQPVSVAGLYDHHDPETGLGFAEYHPKVPEDEHRRVLAYLSSGVTLLSSPVLVEDVLDPERGAVVPVAFRTDGQWAWPAASSYYLMEYNLAPDRGLLEHIRRNGYQFPPVSLVGARRVLSVLDSHTTDPYQDAG